MSIEAMKQALEAWQTHVYGSDIHHNAMLVAMTNIGQAIEEAEKQEPVAWRNAAIRIGEELSSVGPNGYYDMTAQQWIDWAMEQEPKGKTSLPQPKHEWVGLTDEEIDELYGSPMELEHSGALKWVRVIEAKLKEKNT